MIEHSIDYAMGVGFGIFIAIIILIVFNNSSLEQFLCIFDIANKYSTLFLW